MGKGIKPAVPVKQYTSEVKKITKTIKKDKVNIITLGCSKNMVDSEVLSGQLLANDFDVVHENAKLDHNIVVVNTCGFIEIS